jgi:hypothetical protein
MISKLFKDHNWEEILKLPVTSELYPSDSFDDYRGSLLHFAANYHAPYNVIEHLIRGGIPVDLLDSRKHTALWNTPLTPDGLRIFEYLIHHSSKEIIQGYIREAVNWKEIFICTKYGGYDRYNKGHPIFERVRCLLALTQAVMIPRLSVKSTFKLPVDLIRRLREFFQ